MAALSKALLDYAAKEEIKYFITNEAAGELDDATLSAAKKYVDDNNFAKLEDINDMATNETVDSIKTELSGAIETNKQKAEKGLSDLKTEIEGKLEATETTVVSVVEGKLTSFVDKDDVYTKEEVDNKLENKLGFEIVTTLPGTGKDNVLYFKKIEGTKQYLLFKYIDGEFVSC